MERDCHMSLTPIPLNCGLNIKLIWVIKDGMYLDGMRKQKHRFGNSSRRFKR